MVAQHVFAARSKNDAERQAVAWAAKLYGGHPENYDGEVMLLAAWARGHRFPSDQRAALARGGRPNG